MKKVITLVLAVALLLTSVVAIAETHATPNINSFATMKTKYNEKNGVITITLSKPVDRLLVKWAEKGATPEELAVGDDLKATAITWGHKYMPGTSQYYATWVSVNNKVVYDEVVLGYDVDASEVVYSSWVKKETGKDLAFEYEEVGPVRELDPDAPISIEDQIASYMEAYPADSILDYDIELPVEYVDEDGKTHTSFGYIQLDAVYDGINPKSISTVNAKPSDTAYMTVQGEWAVYYNRAGKIVGIEYYDAENPQF